VRSLLLLSDQLHAAGVGLGGDAVGELGLPLALGGAAQSVLAGVVPVRGVAVAHEVHHVSAGAGVVDHAGVPGLAALLIAPVLKGGHTALGHVLIEAAVGVAAAVLGMLLRQAGKAVLGAVPAVQNLLGLGGELLLGGSLPLGEVQAVPRHQDVTDAVVQSLIPLPAVEHGHIVPAAGLIFDDVCIAGGPGLVKEPLAAHAGSAGGAGGIRGVMLLRQLLQISAGLVGVQDLTGCGLGGLHGGSLLLLGGLDGVALVVGLGLGGAGDGDIGGVDQVIGVLIFLVIGLDLLVGVDKILIAVLGGVLAGKDLVLNAGLENAGGHGGTVDRFQVGAVAVARGGGVGLHTVHIGLQGLPVGIVQGDVRLLGGGLGGVDELHGVHGLALEIVVPGLGLVVGLALQALEVLLAKHGGVVVAHLLVVVGHLGYGVLLSPDDGRGLIALDNAGVIDHQGNGNHHENGGNHTVEDVGLALGGPLLGGPGRSGVHPAAGRKFLTLFLFSGCAHVLFIPSKLFCRREWDMAAINFFDLPGGTAVPPAPARSTAFRRGPDRPVGSTNHSILEYALFRK